MLKGDAPLPPIAQLIGFKLTSVTCGQAVIELQAGEQHFNPMGTHHGGVFCDIADAAMGIAYASTLEEGETLATLELKINFLRPIWQAKLRATGKVVHKGHTVGLVECNILDEKDSLIARASCTCMTLRATAVQER
jgi:uncharacterized protein (TIGR00369 family)